MTARRRKSRRPYCTPGVRRGVLHRLLVSAATRLRGRQPSRAQAPGPARSVCGRFITRRSPRAAYL